MGIRQLLIVVLILALAGLSFTFYRKSDILAQELEKLSVQMEQLQTGNNPESIAEAKAIVEKVRVHIVIPGEVEPTVATIVDVDALKANNQFYASAKNGDHLVVTPTRAILYDPDRDIILDVVPVQIQPPASARASEPAAAPPASKPAGANN